MLTYCCMPGLKKKNTKHLPTAVQYVNFLGNKTKGTFLKNKKRRNIPES